MTKRVIVDDSRTWFPPAIMLVAFTLLFTRIDDLRQRISFVQLVKRNLTSSVNHPDCSLALKEQQEALQGLDTSPAAFRAVAFNLKSRGCATEAEAVWLSALKRDPADWLSAAQLGLELQRRGRSAESDTWLVRAGVGILIAWQRIDSGESALQAADLPVAAHWLSAGARLADLSIGFPSSLPSVFSKSLENRWREHKHSVLRDIGLAFYAWPGHLDEATTFYRQSLRDTDSPYTRTLLAQALMQDGCSQEAIGELSGVLDKDPEHRMALRLLSWVQGTCGNYEASASAARTALRQNSIAVEERYEFGAALWKAGFADDALEQWRIALREAPQHVSRHMIPENARTLLESSKGHP